jgi:hypothetical protein
MRPMSNRNAKPATRETVSKNGGLAVEATRLPGQDGEVREG